MVDSVKKKAKFSCVLFIFVGRLVFCLYICTSERSSWRKFLEYPVQKVCFEVFNSLLAFSSHNVLEEGLL